MWGWVLLGLAAGVPIGHWIGRENVLRRLAQADTKARRAAIRRRR